MWKRYKTPIIVGTSIYAIGAWAFVSDGKATFGDTVPFWFLIVGVLVARSWARSMTGRAYEAGERSARRMFGQKSARNDAMKED